jgi:sugar lactone lactonase YvrE
VTAPGPADDPHHHYLDTCAFGAPDRKTLYITEALSGDMLMAHLPVAGKLMYGLQ